MPTFGGVDIFGTAVSIILDTGPASTSFHVSGAFISRSKDEIDADYQRFRSNFDGIAREFVDHEGVSLGKVFLVSFLPRGSPYLVTNELWIGHYQSRFQQPPPCGAPRP